MIEWTWIATSFVLTAAAVTCFIGKQLSNMREISANKEEKKFTADQQKTRDCIQDISKCVLKGTMTFMKRELMFLLIYVAGFTVVVFFLTGARGRKEIYPSAVSGGNPVVQFVQDWWFGLFSALAFIVGALTSAVAGWIGIQCASIANQRVAYKISDDIHSDGDPRDGVQKGFETCLRGGAVMAFGMFTVGVVMLFLLTCLYLLQFNVCDNPVNCDQKAVCYCLLAFALGASAIAVLHRIGGGIYMKAIDWCRLTLSTDETSPRIDLSPFDSRNPATVADNVGDIIGDVAGCGADFFESFAHSICAVLAIMASCINTVEMDEVTPVISHWSLMCLPLMVFQSGIIVSMVIYLLTVSKTSPFNPQISKKPTQAELDRSLKEEEDLEVKNDYIVKNLRNALWRQVLAATLIHAVIMFFTIIIMLPDEFYVDYWFHMGTSSLSSRVVKDWQLGLAAVTGSMVGLGAGYVGLYYTSFPYGSVREVYDNSMFKQLETMLVNGLALGYQSTAASVLNLGLGIYVAHELGHGLGVAFAAMGCMGTCCSVLITTTFGPMAKNAHSMAEMSAMHEEHRKAAEQLATAGNNVLSMSKGFSTTAAALCAIAMVYAYVLRCGVQRVNISIHEPFCIAGLLIGAMLPYRLSAMLVSAMKKVSALLMMNIKSQFREHGPAIWENEIRPNYNQAIQVATGAALQHLIPIALLLFAVPLSTGLLFGRASVVGLVIGCVLSGVPLACSNGTSGAIWAMTRQQLLASCQGPSDGYTKLKAQLSQARQDLHNEGELDEEHEDEDHYIHELKGLVEHAQPKASYLKAEIAEDIADPLKDLISPAISVLMKQTAILVTVVGPYFASIRGGYGALGCSLSKRCDTTRYPLEPFDYILFVVYGVLIVALVGIWINKFFRAPDVLTDDSWMHYVMLEDEEAEELTDKAKPQYGTGSSTVLEAKA